jgi:hypothetical protein
MLNLMIYEINVSICRVNGLTKSCAKLVFQIRVYRCEWKTEHYVMNNSNITLKVKPFFLVLCICLIRDSVDISNRISYNFEILICDL